MKKEVTAMEIGLLAGIELHPKDADVVTALTAAKRKLGGSRDSVIAFKNMGGKVYCRAVLNGTSTATAITFDFVSSSVRAERNELRNFSSRCWR
jgi:hypothetical protein